MWQDSARETAGTGAGGPNGGGLGGAMESEEEDPGEEYDTRDGEEEPEPRDYDDYAENAHLARHRD